jgi:hypothetical protein
MIEQVKAILAGWDNVRAEDNGAYWLVSGSYHGQAHAGTRADPISLAHDLARIAGGFDAGEWSPEVAPPSPNPAPQDFAPPIADALPDAVGGAIDAYPGLFLQRDDEARLRADVLAAISMRKRACIAAVNYGSGLTEELLAFSAYNNARAIGQEIPQSTIDLAEAYMRRTAREQAIREHADKLEDAAVGASLIMLQAMIETHEDGWP